MTTFLKPLVPKGLITTCVEARQDFDKVKADIKGTPRVFICSWSIWRGLAYLYLIYLSFQILEMKPQTFPAE